jgi:predicted DCC family thiol-disulfide oxidoreductase YuxK
VSGRFRIGLEWIETRAMNGECVLCSRGCGFVSKRDRRGYFRFVPLQLAEGRDWFRASVRSIQARL